MFLYTWFSGSEPHFLVIEFDHDGIIARHELKKTRPALFMASPADVKVGIVNWGMNLRTVIADW